MRHSSDIRWCTQCGGLTRAPCYLHRLALVSGHQPTPVGEGNEVHIVAARTGCHQFFSQMGSISQVESMYCARHASVPSLAAEGDSLRQAWSRPGVASRVRDRHAILNLSVYT
jgi:hypothetical protein